VREGAGLLARVARTGAIARQAIGQRRVPHLPDGERHRLRDARVRAIVRYAAETVPHYRDLFRDLGIDPGEIRTAGDLERLPLLDRAQVQADPDRFVSQSPLGRQALLFPTNGTTGTPLPIRHDRESALANIAYGERERVVEAGLAGKRARYVVADINYGPRDTGYQLLRFYREATAIPLRPARHMLRMSETFEALVESMNRLQPDVLQGYGSQLETFLRRVVETGTRMHLPRLILYGSDVMSPSGRRLLEERLGVAIISRYNAVEAFKIGFECELRDHPIHVEDDLCHLRLLRADGSPAPAGEFGEVVISNLVNRGTVLLNYRLGDFASWGPTRCSCGRLTPILSGVEGRLESTLNLPDGRFVPEGAIQVLLKDRGALTFRLKQLEPERYKLELVPSDPAECEQVRDRALRALRALLGDVDIEASCHEALPAGPRGLFRYVVPLSGDAEDLGYDDQ
jgi:phenylacetate-CoA ligase